MSDPYALPMRVCVEWVPPPRMSPNRGTPTRTLKRDRAAAKAAAILAIRGELRGRRVEPYPSPVVFTITVAWPTGRKHWDADNLGTCFKPIVDAFEVEGIIVNDRQAGNPIIRQDGDDGPGYVYVELEAA